LFAPLSIDLSNSGLEKFQHLEFKGYRPKDCKSVCIDTSNQIKKASDALIIEYWVSNSNEDVSEEMVLKSNNVQHKPEQANQLRKVSQNPRNNITNWNEMSTQKLGVGFQFHKKACFVCGSFSHLIKDCDFLDKNMVQKCMFKNVEKGTVQREDRPVWDNAMRTNHQNFSNSRRNFAPTTVLTKSSIVPISTARQSSSRAPAPVSAARPINTATSKPLVIANSVNTAKGNKVTSAVGNQGINAVKSSACWVWRPKIKVQDHVSKNNRSYICKQFDYVDPEGRLKHMIENISYLTEFKEHDRGYVAFRGGAKGGKITSKGTIRTDQLGKLDGKSDKDIFVGYSTTSKTFRVYNIKTRKVEENRHIAFLENKPMIKGGRTEWLFDIDTLSKSMNYATVFAGTNFNDFAGKGQVLM
nr:ribonuclease H-like domain-containing protein [Tanacetum cinerariifolium]